MNATAPKSQINHGTVTERAPTVPLLGRRIAHGDVFVDTIPTNPFEVNFAADRDIVSFALSPFVLEMAHNSDKRETSRLKSHETGLHLTGSQVYSCAADMPSEGYAISFPKSFRVKALDAMNVDQSALQDGLSGVFSPPGAQEMGRLVRRMFLSRTLDNALVAESLAITVIRNAVEAVDGSSLGKQAHSNETITDHKIDRLREFILSDLNRDLSLDELAGIAGISPFHFARSFKQATGLSPHQYVLELRLTRAREELAAGKDSLAGIAYAVGFSSQAHMTDVFKKRLGVTPGRYRKELAA